MLAGEDPGFGTRGRGQARRLDRLEPGRGDAQTQTVLVAELLKATLRCLQQQGISGVGVFLSVLEKAKIQEAFTQDVLVPLLSVIRFQDLEHHALQQAVARLPAVDEVPAPLDEIFGSTEYTQLLSQANAVLRGTPSRSSVWP